MTGGTALGYKYDVFLSYHHDSVFEPWVNGFIGQLQTRLKAECGMGEVFYDRKDIPIGTEWPGKLRGALAQSKCLIALWTNMYFKSTWCMYELHTMIERTQKLGPHISLDHPGGLVFPVVLADSSNLEEDLARIQYMNVNSYFHENIFTSGSPDTLQLEKKIQSLVVAVKPIIETPPSWQADWLTLPPPEFAHSALTAISIQHLVL